MANIELTLTPASPTGSMVFTLGAPGQQGPVGPPGPAGPQGVPGNPGVGVPTGGASGQILAKASSANYDTVWVNDTSASWGSITGTLSAQLDLQSALDGKYSTTNPAGYITSSALAGYATESFVTSQGYITSSALTPYLTSATAASTYYPLTNPAGYITSAALTPYLTITTAASTYQTIQGMSGYLDKAGNLSGIADISVARSNLGLGNGSQAEFYSVSMVNGTYNANLDASSLQMWNTSTSDSIVVDATGIVFPDNTKQVTAYVGPDGSAIWGNITGNLSAQTDLQSALNGKYSTTNPAGYITSGALTPYLTIASAASTYYPLSNPTGFITSSALAPYLTSATAATTYAPIASGQPVSGTVGQVLTKNSGTNYDSSWTTLIPGDRYLTTSTTSNTIGNGAKTFTAGSGLSYTTQQDVVIAYDSANHMHAVVTSYDSVTGVLVVDVQNHTGSGTYALWTINVGGTVPVASVSWGSITGTLGNQTDLASALNAKANLAGATFTGKVNLATISAASPSVNLGGQCNPEPASAVSGDLWISNATSPKVTYRVGAVNYNLAALNQFNTFTGQVAINTTSSATAALRVTQLGTGNAIQVEDSTTPDATPFVVDQFGKVGIGVSPDATAALKVDTNGIMFGDGTTQTTAASAGISIATANFVSVSSSISAACSNFVAHLVSGPDGVYFTFDMFNAYTLSTMAYDKSISCFLYATCVSGPYEGITCQFTLGSGTVTTDTMTFSGDVPTGQTYNVYMVCSSGTLATSNQIQVAQVYIS